MSKKVYFTQEQLNHIMGEDVMNGGGYLDKTSMGSEYPTDSIPATDSEVIQTEPGGDSRTADSYADQKIPNNMWLRRGNYSLYENGKKKVKKGKTLPIYGSLNERNAELDGKNLYSLPQEVRAFATPDGVHDDIMARLKSGEQMNLASLYRLRNELQDSSNDKIKNAIDSTIKRAQMQGSTLRDAHSDNQNIFNSPKSVIPQKGHRKEGNTKIYYEKD